MSALPVYSPIRFFISSTFADFVTDRDLLQRRVFTQLRRLCQAHGVAFQPIDLRWGVSEEASHQQRTLPIIFEQIRRCQQVSPDFFLLILHGDRYGSRLPPVSIPLNQFDRLRAALSPQERELLQTWYRVDENAVPPEAVLLAPQDPAFQEAERQAELLNMLAEASKRAGFAAEMALPFIGSVTHQEVAHGLLTRDPTSAGVLAVLRSFTSSPDVSAALGETDRQARAQQDDLRSAILQRLPASQILHLTIPLTGAGAGYDEDFVAEAYLALLRPKVEAAIANREREEGGDPVLRANQRFVQERGAHFTGREQPLAEIGAYLDAPNRVPLVVTGPSGAGKSTLLAVAEVQTRQRHPHAVVVARYVGITPGTSSLVDLLESLRVAILAAYDQPAPEPATDLITLINAFPPVLTQATEAKPLILVIDGLDQFGTPPQRTLNWLPHELPEHVAVVLSLLDDRPEVSALLGRRPKPKCLVLDNMTRQEGAALLTHWLADEERRLQPMQEAAVLDAFASEGRPLFLRLAFEQARAWHSFDLPHPLPVTIKGILHQVFERLEQGGEHGPVLVAHALGDMVAAREGLAEGELLDVLARDADVRREYQQLAPLSPPIDAELPLPVVLWARLEDEIERYLTERDGSGARVVTPYHRQVREMLEDRYLQGAARLGRHRDLSAYFTGLPLKTETVPNLRKLAEQPYQQDQGSDRDALVQTLTDESFLVEKIRGFGVEATVSDLELLPDLRAAHELVSVVRTGSLVLAKDPVELGNQMTGRVGTIEGLHDPAERVGLWFRLNTQTLFSNEGLVHALVGHTDQTYACVFSPDGTRALSASADTTLRLWDVQTGECLHIFEGHTRIIAGCAFSPDGMFALSASSDTTVRLWDVQTGDCLRTFTGHSNSAVDCAFSPDGRQALSASYDGTLRLWDLRTGDCLRVFPGVYQGGDSYFAVNACAFSPDGRSVLAAYDSGGLLLLDAQTGAGMRAFSGHTDDVNSCAFNPDGTQILSASSDSCLRLWDVQTGACVRVFEGEEAELSRQRLRYSGGLWGDVQTTARPHVLQGHATTVYGCAFSPDGRRALSASKDRTLRLWDVLTGETLQVLRGPTCEVFGCAFSPDGKHVLGALEDGTLRLWDVTMMESAGVSQRHLDWVRGSAFSPDGRQALSASGDTTLRLWDTQTGASLRVFRGHTYYAYGCAFSPDGKQMLSASWDTTLRLWDVPTGEVIRAFEGSDAHVYCCAFSPDGMTVLSGSGDVNRPHNSLRLWDVRTGKCLQILRDDFMQVVRDCAFSPDGELALGASGGYGGDNTLRLWDLRTGDCLRVFQGHSDWVESCAFSPDGRSALSASDDATLRLWDLQTGECLRVFQGHSSVVHCCAFSPDGKQILSASRDSTLRLWDVQTGSELAVWLTDVILYCCAFHPSGTRAMAGDSIGGLHLFTIMDGATPVPAQVPPAQAFPSDGLRPIQGRHTPSGSEAHTRGPSSGSLGSRLGEKQTQPKKRRWLFWRR